MAHFAKLDTDNTVLTVVTLDDAQCPNDNEEAGRAYLESVHGWPNWKRTSYNTFAGAHKTEGKTAFRGNYAGPGYTYDSVNDVFIPPKPYPSWTWDSEKNNWQPPVAFPSDMTDATVWNESKGEWENE